MKNTLFALTNWFASDPRRVAAVMLVIITLMVLTSALLPTDVAIAGEITSGS